MQAGMATKKTKTTPTRFGRPQKTSIIAPILAWLFVVVGLIGIAWMIILSPPEKKLKCEYNPSPSLLAFGTCTTED
jgi:hypothetical protein